MSGRRAGDLIHGVLRATSYPKARAIKEDAYRGLVYRIHTLEAPVLARNLDTVLPSSFAVQTLAPSVTTPMGRSPARKMPSTLSVPCADRGHPVVDTCDPHFVAVKSEREWPSSYG